MENIRTTLVNSFSTGNGRFGLPIGRIGALGIAIIGFQVDALAYPPSVAVCKGNLCKANQSADSDSEFTDETGRNWTTQQLAAVFDLVAVPLADEEVTLDHDGEDDPPFVMLDAPIP